MLQLSRDSLLSIATQFVAHFANIRIVESGGRGSSWRKVSFVPGAPTHSCRTKIVFEPQSVSVS